MSSKIFSGIDSLPRGTASEEVTPGCIVLEGGAFRGLYTEGVLDALMEAGINFECTIGVSAGAMNGICYVSGQIGRAARFSLRYRHDSRYISWAKIFQIGRPLNYRFAFQHIPGDPLDEERFLAKGSDSLPRRPTVGPADRSILTGIPAGISIRRSVPLRRCSMFHGSSSWTGSPAWTGAAVTSSHISGR